MRMIQALVAVVGRFMLCSIFLMAAVANKIPHFNAVADLMATKGIPAPKFMLLGAIAFLIVGSVSVVLGYKARFGALLLLVFLALASYYFHNFWAVTDLKEQQDQMAHFMKNFALMGTFVFLIAAGPGPGSLDGRRAIA